MKQKNNKTAAELIAELSSDPAYAERTERIRKERDARLQEAKKEGTVIVTDLNQHGFRIQSLSDLVPLRQGITPAIPILLKWLKTVKSLAVKEDIIRTLSVPWAAPFAADEFIAEFKKLDSLQVQSVKWALGNAVEVFANGLLSDDMMDIVLDKRHGSARQMVVLGLGKLSDSRVPDVLISLLDDEEVLGHAIDALGRLRTKKARNLLLGFKTHPKAWVRNAAKKAIKRIDE